MAQPWFEVTHPIAGIREPCNLAAGLCIYSFELLRAAFSDFLWRLSIGQALVGFFCVSGAKCLKSLEAQNFAHLPFGHLPQTSRLLELDEQTWQKRQIWTTFADMFYDRKKMCHRNVANRSTKDEHECNFIAKPSLETLATKFLQFNASYQFSAICAWIFDIACNQAMYFLSDTVDVQGGWPLIDHGHDNGGRVSISSQPQTRIFHWIRGIWCARGRKQL